jgi:hypothetical protein
VMLVDVPYDRYPARQPAKARIYKAFKRCALLEMCIVADATAACHVSRYHMLALNMTLASMLLSHTAVSHAA